MDQTNLLLEYLKEHYTQARQHENRQTSATAFLTSAVGLLLGVALKDGLDREDSWIGILVALTGLANWLINEAHFEGNRFHTSVASATRKALEKAIPEWTAKKPTEIRKHVLAERKLTSVGKMVHEALRFVPIGVIALGVVVAIVPWLT